MGSGSLACGCEKTFKEAGDTGRIRCMGSIFQEPVPYNSRIRFRLKQPVMKPLIRVDLSPIRHVGIEVLVDRRFRRRVQLIP